MIISVRKQLEIFKKSRIVHTSHYRIFKRHSSVKQTNNIDMHTRSTISLAELGTDKIRRDKSMKINTKLPY